MGPYDTQYTFHYTLTTVTAYVTNAKSGHNLTCPHTILMQWFFMCGTSLYACAYVGVCACVWDSCIAALAEYSSDNASMVSQFHAVRIACWTLPTLVWMSVYLHILTKCWEVGSVGENLCKYIQISKKEQNHSDIVITWLSPITTHTTTSICCHILGRHHIPHCGPHLGSWGHLGRIGLHIWWHSSKVLNPIISHCRKQSFK